jgi:hypothetical protein
MNTPTPAFSQHAIEQIAKHEARLDGVDRLIEHQNTLLSRIEDKIDAQKSWLIGALASAVGSLLFLSLSAVKH